MIPKIYTGEEETRRLILDGARTVFDAVKSTYSPKSGNIAIELNWGQPVISHDGVTVARAISDKDGRKNTGIRLVVEASEMTNRNAGDGTSLTVILTYKLLERANKLIAAGYNAMELRRGMDRAAVAIKEEIMNKVIAVTPERLKQVAIVSSGSEDLGMLIAETILEIGENSAVTVENGGGINTEADIIDGFHWGKGADSPYMWNEPDLRRAAYDDVFVMVVNRTIKEINEIKPILQLLNQQEKKNLLIVGNVTGHALDVILANKLQGLSNVMTVAPVAFGNQTIEFLQDAAIVTGATVITDAFDLDKLTTDQWGWADRVVARETNTTIFGGEGDKKQIAERIKTVKANIKDAKDSVIVERLEERLAKLSGKIGVIRVGAPTETDRKEKILRVEDAVMAVRAAREDGVVPGGATTLLRIGATGKPDGDMSDQMIGYRMVFDAIQDPFKILLNNTGVEDIGYHKHAVLAKSFGYGYNVRELTPEPIDLVKAGIIDPAKVLVQAVQNSVSNAGVLVSTNGIITFDREEIRKDRGVED